MDSERDLFHAAMDALPSGVAVIDNGGSIRWVNRAWRLFAREHALSESHYAPGRDYLTVCDEAVVLGSHEAMPASAGIRSVLAGTIERFQLDYAVRDPFGERWFRLVAQPFHSTRSSGAVVTRVDITEIKLAERAGQVFRTAVEATADLVVITDPTGRVEYVNPSFVQRTGYRSDEVTGRELTALKIERHDGAPLRELAFAFATGSQVLTGAALHHQHNSYLENLSVAPVHQDGKIVRFVAIKSGISERQTNDARIGQLALHDDLTGLPNWMLFRSLIEHALLRLDRADHLIALLYLDLDDFKCVNERHGYTTGDQLLMAFTHRLLDSIRMSDAIARIKDDEFVILFDQVSSLNDVILSTNRIINAIAQPFVIGDKLISIRTSVGVAVTRESEYDADDLLHEADLAVYEAKRTGKNRSVLIELRPMTEN